MGRGGPEKAARERDQGNPVWELAGESEKERVLGVQIIFHITSELWNFLSSRGRPVKREVGLRLVGDE